MQKTSPLISPTVAAYAGPFACYLVFLVIRTQFDAGQGAAFRWIYAVQVALVALVMVAFRRYYTELHAAWPKWQMWALSALCGVIVFVLWINLTVPWMKMGEAAGYSPLRTDGSVDLLLASTRLVGAALIVPPMEELFWRSFVMRWMVDRDFLRVDPRAVTWFALAAVSLVFGLEHDLWFAGLVAGLAYGWLYMRTGSLWAPIFAHAVTNGLLGVWVLMYARWEFW